MSEKYEQRETPKKLENVWKEAPIATVSILHR